MTDHEILWRVSVLPDDNTMPAEEVLPKIPAFNEEHETREAAISEAERVLCEIREQHDETGWSALCVRYESRKGSRTVIISEGVEVRLKKDA